MRFITMVKSAVLSGPPPQELMDAIQKSGEEAMKAGIMVETGGLGYDQATVRVSGGQMTVTDGPYAEAKEVIGGYAIFELDSKEQALEEAKRFMELHVQYWPEWSGECEVRQILGPNDPPPWA